MTIRHSRGSYEVLDFPMGRLLDDLGGSAYVITDENLATFATSGEFPTLVLPPGEGSKSLEVYARCLAWLVERGATRKATVVALGGGVIGDLAGFVAATYMRGIRFVQIPTSLLAQVDSSVGGKVGIDLESGKNMVGAFYPPAEVRLCADLLKGLPPRQFESGMAEVWKYAAIMDTGLFENLANRRLTASDDRLPGIVRRCIALKAEVVEADEFETTGRRAILNFGHTVAHAVESLTGFGPVLHGEAVSIGMVAEARVGERAGITPPGTATVLAEFLNRQDLPIAHPILKDAESMISAMRRDKKAVEGRLAFSLLTEIGGCRLFEGVCEEDVRATLIEG